MTHDEAAAAKEAAKKAACGEALTDEQRAALLRMLRYVDDLEALSMGRRAVLFLGKAVVAVGGLAGAYIAITNALPDWIWVKK